MVTTEYYGATQWDTGRSTVTRFFLVVAAVSYIAKSRLWARCWDEGSLTKCQIFDSAGEMLQNDVFVIYSDQRAVEASE